MNVLCLLFIFRCCISGIFRKGFYASQMLLSPKYLGWLCYKCLSRLLLNAQKQFLFMILNTPTSIKVISELQKENPYDWKRRLASASMLCCWIKSLDFSVKFLGLFFGLYKILLKIMRITRIMNIYERLALFSFALDTMGLG